MKPHTFITVFLTMASPYAYATEPESSPGHDVIPTNMEKPLPNPFENHWDSKSWDKDNGNFWHTISKTAVARKKPEQKFLQVKLESTSQKKINN